MAPTLRRLAALLTGAAALVAPRPLAVGMRVQVGDVVMELA